MGRALWPFILIGAIIIVVIVGVKFGVSTVMNFVDPGGGGDPIMAWPLSKARAPHVIRNLGIVLFLGGFVPAAIHHRVRDIGMSWLGWGLLMFLVGLLAPSTADWAQTSFTHWWSMLLNHPGDLWSQATGQ